MKMREKVTILLVALMMGPIMSFAEENQVTNECDTTYIKLDENRVPITHVNLTYDELVEKVGELETILETDEFQLYAAGDYTYKVVGGIVTSMAIQIPDDNNDKVVYNQILNALAKSNSLKDTHNTGGNYYQYANFQIQFDDFEGYINTGRGRQVNEPELAEVLEERPDLTALLDVTDPEPPRADSKLYRLPNVILSPHIAGSWNDELHRMSDYMIEEYRRYAAGEPCFYEVRESMLLTSRA